MANVTQTIPSYTAGISQQPDEVKVPGQVNIAKNVFPDITEGLMKRPGTKFIKQLDSAGTATDSQDAGKWFHYYRDETEQYLGQISRTGDINMWKCSDGSVVNVNYVGSSSALSTYLTHTNDQDLQTLTLNDYTYITNRTKTTAMSSTKEASRPDEAFIDLKKVAYSSQYSLNIFNQDGSNDNHFTTTTTATRIRVELIKSSNNYCDANGFMLDHAGRTSATIRCDNSSGDGRDAYAPNVGTRIFSINSNSSLTDDSAAGGVKADSSNTSTAYNYTVSVYNSSNQGSQTGRSNLYFRITTTGQSVPFTDSSGPDDSQATTYQARYTTTNDLLHGGEGWLTGDSFHVWLKDGYYKVIIEETSESKIQANLGLIRPTPTSFDTKTTVTAESILGALQAAITETPQVIIAIDHNTINRSVDSNPHTITLPNHGLSTGDKVVYTWTNSQGTGITYTPVSDYSSGHITPAVNTPTEFWVIPDGTDRIKLASSESNANAGTQLYITGDGNTGQQIQVPYITGWNPTAIKIIGNGIYISNSGNFNISTSVGELLNVLTDSVKDIADLPQQCKHGYVVKVANSEAEEDDYYVKFFGNNDRDGEGVWEECAKPGTDIEIDPGTMPLVLIRTENGEFTLTALNGANITGNQKTIATSSISASDGHITINSHGYSSGDKVWYYKNNGEAWKAGGSYPSNDPQPYWIRVIDVNTVSLAYSQEEAENANGMYYVFTAGTGNNNQYLLSNASNQLTDLFAPKWDNAQVGDTSVDGTNPRPSFIGKTINKMMFFRNRFVLLSDENVIMSRPGDFYNFWAKSAIAFTGTDPIDISCSSEYPAIIYDGIQVNSGLVLFTKNQQFMLTTDSDVLSPLTAKINFISAYNFNHNTNPFSLGTTIGFLENVGEHSRFMEMARVLREGEPDVIEQSKVVSKLLDKDLNIISASKENGFIAFSEKDKHILYCYKYFNTSDKRAHQAWFTWDFEKDIQYHFIIDDYLYIVVDDHSKCMLLRLDFKRHSDTPKIYQGNIFVPEDIERTYLDYAVTVDIPESYYPSTPDATGVSYSKAANSTLVTISLNNHGYSIGQKVRAKANVNAYVDKEIIASGFTPNSFKYNDTWLNSNSSAQTGTTDVTGQISPYNPTTNKTTYPLPANWWTFEQSEDDMVVYANRGQELGWFDGPSGFTGDISISNGNFVVDGDWHDLKVTLGIPYEMEVELPKIYTTSIQGDSVRSDTRSSLVLHRAKLNLGASGFFQTILTRKGKPTYTEDHEAPIADNYEANEPAYNLLQTKVIPIYDRNTNTTLTLKSNHPSPLTLYSMTWEGNYTNKFYSSV